MKKQAFIELFVGATGTAVLFAFRNEWTYLPLVIFGIISIFMTRKINLSEKDKDIIKKRKLSSLILLSGSIIICYFSMRNTVEYHSLWLIAATYIFLTGHGLLLLAPTDNNANE